LQKSVDKFEHRFNKVKQLTHEQGLETLNNQPFNELMKLWDQAKQDD
jgi:uncharacterized protein YabN with tetrapyrrole methylase and pyrophosphatase domain